MSKHNLEHEIFFGQIEEMERAKSERASTEREILCEINFRTMIVQYI